jgi:outer membrane protein assembly factor BamB
MEILKNRSKISAITFVLVLTISAMLVAFPAVGAHDPAWTVPTWTFVALTNDIVGVNQQAVIVFWSNLCPPTATGAYGDRWTHTVEITKPDGSKETLGPYESDPVGGGWAIYTPNQVGTYSIVAIVDEHVITGEPAPPGGVYSGTFFNATEYIGDVYLSSTSDPVILTVQEDPIEPWEETPLPTEYWELPINAMNRNWYVLAGNWLAGAAHNVGPTTNFGYGTGPESAHIMWATPMWSGGIMDARFGNTGYQTGHYEGISFTPPIVLDGRIYYNVQSLPREGWYCLDLYTGEELYFHNTTGPVTGLGGGFDSSGAIQGEALSFGQIYDYSSPNQHGGMPYLWSTPPVSMFGPGDPNAQQNWMMFDAYSGNYICSIANAPSWASGGGFFAASTQVYGKEGSITAYNIAGTSDPTNPFAPETAPFYLQVWNTSRAIWYEETWSSNEYWMWRPTLNMTFDGNNGYSLNVTIPEVQGDILAIREGEFIIGGTSGQNNDLGVIPGHLWCLSLKSGQEGSLLWNRTFTPPQEVPSTALQDLQFSAHDMMGPYVDPEDGIFHFYQTMTRERWGYSLETGEMLWGPTDPEPQMKFYGMSHNVYQGMLLSYTGLSSGGLVAYNITTGEVLWEYTAEQEGFESPYGDYPLSLACVADGKLYMYSTEHSQTQPLWRGSQLRCIEAKTGKELWKINHYGAAVIADGYLVGLNYYDNRIYCYGKGPSSTTVTAPDMGVPLGSSVVIRGTVTDQSPGAKSLAVMAKSPNEEGVPCIADEDQQAWMEYLYMQQEIPMTMNGVEVSLDAIDPNGNFVHIDTVRSDMSGMFSYQWIPEMEGKYTIMATFGGSKAYYSSYAETAIGVDPAEAPAQPIEPEEPTAEAPLITTEIAVLIAAVIVALAVIVGFWFIRKRK